MNKLAMRDDLIRMREECVQAAEYETKLHHFQKPGKSGIQALI